MNETSTMGLTVEEVAQRKAEGKLNALPNRSGKTVWDILRTNIFTRINAMLGVLLICVLTTGSWMNAAFGLLIIANSAIGIIQELRAKKTLDELAVVGQAKPLVRRVNSQGQTVSERIDQEQIVLDDIIELSPGDQLVVDGQVIEADQLEIDESLLTGESDAVVKKTGEQLLSGSYAVSGSGAYRATKIGTDSYAAQLTSQASKFSLAHSQLQAGINKILKVITWILIPVGIATIVVQLKQAGGDWSMAILRMAGALVPMVPEGLVLLTSTAFALGVIRLGKQKVLVQELPAIEGLARVDVLCADKTGTLTENKLDVAQLIIIDSLDKTIVSEALQQLASLDRYPNASIKAIEEQFGQPTTKWQLVARQYFSSETKWSGASFNNHGTWVLGAPEILVTGELARQASDLANKGLRVLALAKSTIGVKELNIPNDLDAVALVVMEQTIRCDARETLEYFTKQNVELKIISGDNAQSVAAIAQRLEINNLNVIDARTLNNEQELSEVVEKNQIFGRVNPNQKRAMVSALQSQGHTVAMTGDGVNDVLALKDADLGIAMGSGASATRSVAKIVLLDDKFSRLPHVVSEGRRVLGNIERVAKLFLTKTVYSALLAFLTVIFALPFPFQPIHITITGWFTIGIPAFLLSLAPNNARAKPKFVSRVMRFGAPAGVIVAIASFVTYLLARRLFPEEISGLAISTATLITLIVAATWVLAIVARPYNWWRICLIILAYLAYLTIFAVPALHPFFLLDVTNIELLGLGLLIGLLAAALIEASWWMNRWISQMGNKAATNK